MNNLNKISKFKSLDEKELQTTSGGMLLFCLAVDIAIGLAIYGAFTKGYNDGRAAAGN